MKTIILKSVVLLALAFAGVWNADLSAKDKFYTNKEINNGLIVSKTIYVNDGYLHNHLKYNYSYDEMSRLAVKDAFKWNEESGDWVPYYRTNISYAPGGVELELGYWNPAADEYNLLKEKSVYELDVHHQPVAYLAYKWDNNESCWKEIDDLSYGNAHGLFAIGE